MSVARRLFFKRARRHSEGDVQTRLGRKLHDRPAAYHAVVDAFKTETRSRTLAYDVGDQFLIGYALVAHDGRCRHRFAQAQ